MVSSITKKGSPSHPESLGLWLVLGILVVATLLVPWTVMKIELVLPILIAYIISVVWSRGRVETGVGVCVAVSGLPPLGCPRVAGLLVVLLVAVHLLAGTSRPSLRLLRNQRMLAALVSVLAAAKLANSTPQEYFPILIYVALSFVMAWFMNSDSRVKTEIAREAISDGLWLLGLGVAAELGNLGFLIVILLWLAFGALGQPSVEGELSEAFTTQMGVAEQTLRESENRRLKERELIKNLASLQVILDGFQGAALKSQSVEQLGKCLLTSIENLKRNVDAGLARVSQPSRGFLSSIGTPQLKKFRPFPKDLAVRQTLRSPDGQRLLCSLSSEVCLCLDLATSEADELTREIVQNLLERTYLVAEILEQQKQLAQLVTEKSEALRSLAQSQEKLVQSGKMAAVGQLAAGVAHEINSPLAAIHVQTQLATRRLGKGDIEGVGRSLETSLSASTRAKAIIENLLTFSRMSDGSKSEVSLAEAARLGLAMVEAHPGSPEVEVVSNLSQVHMVEANLQDLQHIITNICLNALDALCEREKSPRILSLETSSTDKHVRLDIRNNGPAIPTEVASKLFEPFFTTKEVGRGTGLGLSIAYELSENLGAKLFLLPDDEWVCFRLEFPAME